MCKKKPGPRDVDLIAKEHCVLILGHITFFFLYAVHKITHTNNMEINGSASMIAFLVFFVLWTLLWILAIRSASKGRYTREIPTVEMLTAFNSPFQYWILRLFGVLGRRKSEKSEKICHTA